MIRLALSLYNYLKIKWISDKNCTIPHIGRQNKGVCSAPVNHCLCLWLSTLKNILDLLQSSRSNYFWNLTCHKHRKFQRLLAAKRLNDCSLKERLDNGLFPKVLKQRFGEFYKFCLVGVSS